MSEKPNVIRRIVNLKQLHKRWRNSTSNRIPPDVPAGHIAVYVGARFKRFVIRACYLNHPLFKNLLSQVEEEFGFANQGPLLIPCDESVFQEVLNSVSRSQSSSSHGGADLELLRKRCYGGGDIFSDPRPLVGEKSIC